MIGLIRVELLFPGDAAVTDVSHLVRDKSPAFERQGFSDDKLSAVDVFRCTLKHDAALIAKFQAAASRISVWVKDYTTDAALFTGAVEPSFSQSSAQVVGDLSLEAVDNSWRLDEKISTSFQYPASVGGTPYYVFNPADAAHSIFHLLLTMAGYTSAEISASGALTDTVLHCAATAGDSTYREFLDELLFETRHTFHPSAAGVFEVLPWDHESSAYEETIEGEASDRDSSLSVVEPMVWSKRAEYRDGAKVTWAETKTLYSSLVYRADLPVSSEGVFEGQAIAAGDYYPADSDIQDTYQSFVDSWLDLPYLARETRLKNQDLSLIATSDHVVVFQADTGIEIDLQVFESGRAQVRFHNTTGATAYIYSFEIYATALIRAAVRTETVPSTSVNPKEYTSRFVFDSAAARALANALALDVQADKTYTFGCNAERAAGRVVRLIETRNGVDTLAMIQLCKASQRDPVYRFQAVALSTYSVLSVLSEGAAGSSLWQTVQAIKAEATGVPSLSLSASASRRARNNTLTPASVTMSAALRDGTGYLGRFTVELSHNGGATYQAAVYTSGADEVSHAYTIPATMVVSSVTYFVTAARIRLYASGGLTVRYGEQVVSVELDPDLAAVYLGIGILTSLTTRAFTGATVAADGTITPGGTVSNIVAGDTVVNYSASGGVATLGLYKWSGTAWSKTGITSDDKMGAAEDLLNLSLGGVTTDEGTAIVTLFVRELFVGDVNATGGITTYDGQGVNRRYLRTKESNLDFGDSPVGGTERLRLRLGRLGVNGPVLADGDIDFVGLDENAAWGSESVINVISSFHPTYIQLVSGELRVAYQRSTDGYLVERIWDGSAWGAESVINAASSYFPAYIQLASGELRVAYRRNSDSYLVERIWDGSAWGAESVISAASSDYPTYIQLVSGELRVAYQRNSDSYLVERIWDGSAWGAESVINAASSDYPTYIQLVSGELRVAYRRNFDSYLVERIWDGSAWGAESVINEDLSDCPAYIQLVSGELRVAYQRNSDSYLVERIWNGSAWGAESVINAASSYFPAYIQLASGELRVAYRRNSDSYLVERTLARYSRFITEADLIREGTFVPEITAATTNPTKGATILIDQARYHVTADKYMEVWYKFAQSAAGSAGSGTYFFGLIPAGWEIDLDRLPLASSTTRYTIIGECSAGTAANEIATANQIVGAVGVSSTGQIVFIGTVPTYTTAGVNLVGSGFMPLSNAAAGYSAHFRVPVKISS